MSRITFVVLWIVAPCSVVVGNRVASVLNPEDTATRCSETLVRNHQNTPRNKTENIGYIFTAVKTSNVDMLRNFCLSLHVKYLPKDPEPTIKYFILLLL